MFGYLCVVFICWLLRGEREKNFHCFSHLKDVMSRPCAAYIQRNLQNLRTNQSKRRKPISTKVKIIYRKVVPTNALPFYAIHTFQLSLLLCGKKNLLLLYSAELTKLPMVF
jgi:hypothetical protein